MLSFIISVCSWWFLQVLEVRVGKGLQQHQGLTQKLIKILIIKLSNKCTIYLKTDKRKSQCYGDLNSLFVKF